MKATKTMSFAGLVSFATVFGVRTVRDDAKR